MRHRLLVSFALASVLVAGALILSGQRNAATAANRPQPALASMPRCPDANVTFRLTTNSPAYLPGQPVRINLEVRNTSASWCTVAGQCDEVAPLSIFDSGRMIWSDRPCYNHEWDAVKIPLAPGRLVVYQGSWSTRGVRGGWYGARAEFLKTSFLIL
jgi:hypothetical protein